MLLRVRFSIVASGRPAMAQPVGLAPVASMLLIVMFRRAPDAGLVHAFLEGPGAVAQADEDRGPDAGHGDVRHNNAVHRPAVDDLQRDAGQAGVVDCAAGHHDILEAAVRFGPHLEGIARAPQDAAADDHVLAQAGRGALEHDGVVAGVDVAAGDDDPVAGVDVDAVVVVVHMALDGDAVDADVVAGEIVLDPHGRVANRDASRRRRRGTR